jgi:hypothetical protein
MFVWVDESLMPLLSDIEFAFEHPRAPMDPLVFAMKAMKAAEELTKIVRQSEKYEE